MAVTAVDLSRILNAKASGDSFRCACPIHGGKNKTAFSFKEVDGKVIANCFGGCHREEVVAWLRDQGVLGHKWDTKPERPQKWDGLPLAKVYKYKDGVTCRYQEGDRKVIIPFFKNGGLKAGGQSAHFYNEECLKNNNKIFVVEGEKCVDAMKDLGIFNVITYQGGSSRAKTANWSRLAGKRVYIWPDNDAQGAKAAEAIKEQVEGAKICMPEGSFPEGYDVADFIASGKTKAEVLDVFEEKPLIFLDVNAFLAENIPARRLLFGVTFEESITMVHAWRGIGKTWFSLSYAFAAATGSPYLNYAKGEKPLKTLYLDGEMGMNTMHMRLGKVCQMFGGVSPEPGMFSLWGQYTDKKTSRMLKLNNYDDRERIYETVALQGIEFLVADNLSSLTEGDENSSEIFGPIQDFFITLRNLGCSVMFVHHSNKNGTQRGTSRHEDAVDTTISLRGIDTFERPEATFNKVYEKTRETLDSTPRVCYIKNDMKGLEVIPSWNHMTKQSFDELERRGEDPFEYHSG